MVNPKWVLVTGGTGGIGLATALMCALKGHQVIATGRTDEKLALLESAAQRANVTIRRARVDVSDDASIQQLKNDVLTLTNGYGVDVLVNNAGYAEAGAIEEIPLERLRRQFDTNVFGLVAVTQALLPFMRQRRQGTIVNISSVLGKVTIPLMGAYCATKHAVESLSDAMRMELAESGIHVVTVAPGSIKTEFGNTLIRGIQPWLQDNSPYRQAYQKFLQDRASDRGAEPTVIAAAVVHAMESANPRARYAVPYDSKLMPVATGLLPGRMVDRVMRSVIMGKRHAP